MSPVTRPHPAPPTQEGMLVPDTVIAATSPLPAVPDTPGAILRRVNEVEAIWDDLDDLDLVPGTDGMGVPFIRTNGNIDGGLEIDGKRVDEVLCVIAARSISRSKFEKTWDEDKNARPICWSADGITPDPSAPQPQAARCAGCPMSFEVLGNTKQTCRKNVELLAYVPDANDIAIMRFRIGGISVKHANAYWQSFRTRIPKKHPIGFVTKVTMVLEETTNGNKLAVSFERYSELRRDEVEVFIADARARKTMWQQMVAADITDAAAQTVEDPARDPFSDEACAASYPAADTAPFADPATGEIITPARYVPESDEAPF